MVEALVVCVIIAIVMALGLMRFSAPNEQFQRQNSARELKVAFERARFDSVKRRGEGLNGTPVPAKVEVNPGSFTLFTDANRDGTYETQTTTLSSNIVIAGYGLTILPLTVEFDKRGEAITLNNAQPHFLVCNGDCLLPSATNANLLIVTPTGTVNLLPGGATVPTFGVPISTSVNTSAGINPDTILP